MSRPNSKASEDWDTDMEEKTNKNMKKQFGDFYDPNFNAMDVPPEPKQQSVKDILADFRKDMEQFDESKASEYSIKEEFDLQDQDGKYEMLSKADLSVADATNYSTYSHSELPEEVKDSLKGDEDSYGESWSRKSSIDKIEALERLGIKQGDAIKLSGVEFEDFGEDLQGALKGDVEDARMHMKADKDMLDKADPLEPSYSFQWQQGGEVDNPNSEFGQNYPDYNKIGESQTSMTKYECEHCNLGFKSNESLSRHHKSIHKIASEDIDGYSVDAGFTGQNSFTDMSSISKEDVTQEWWNNVATPSSKARILNNTGTPVENTFGLPSYYELTQETKAYLLGLDDFSFESKASEFMTELEQMKHGAWNDDFDFNQSKLYVSTPAQKRQYQMQGIPTESNGEPKYSELYDDDLYAVQEIQESPIPDQVDVYDHDTFLPVKYDEIVPDDFSYRPSTWGESKANESDTFLPRSDPLFSDEEIVGGIRKHYDTVDYYQDDRPDFNNDPDFEGNVNGINVEPSQYIQSGMDHTDYGRGDIDESKANENKTYTCDKCGKVGDSFTDMAQEECPADVNANHQIPIFGDQVKPRGIGEEHYSMYFDQAYSDMNDENPITGYKQCEYCDAQFGEYDKQGMIDHANSHDADLDPVTGDSRESMASEKEDPMHYKRSGGWNILDKDQNNTGSWYAKGDLVNARKEADIIDGHVADDETGSLVYTSWLKNDVPSWFVIESKASEGSEDVYNYEYVDDKVVCKNCGMKFDSAIDDARAMKDHSEIHESLYDKEAYAHEDDLDTLMWDNENPDDKGKQWKDKKGKKQESKAVEYTDEEQKILDHTMEAARMEGFAMDPNAFTTPHTWVQGSAGANDIYCKICGVSKSFENHPTEDEMDVLDPYRSYRKSPDKPQKTWDYRETDESKANEDFGNAQQKWNSLGWMGRSNVLKKVGLDNISPDTNVWELNSNDWDIISAELIDYDTESKANEDITFADQHRGIQKDMIEFIRRKGGSASELDIDREFDLLNNFNNEYKHLQALKNDGTLTSAGWQPDNSGNDGYPDGSYIYNLNESYSSESDVSFGTLSDYLGIDYSDGGDYCKICGKDLTYAKDNELLNHVNSHDDKTLLEGESKASEAGLDDHSCPECGFISSDNSDYVDHLNAHED